jgi:hypothetical protein
MIYPNYEILKLDKYSNEMLNKCNYNQKLNKYQHICVIWVNLVI